MTLPDAYDLEAWISRCPVTEEDVVGMIDVGCGGNGPKIVAQIELARRMIFGNAPTSLATVPTDYFVLAKGEPSCRSVTKVGGVPYRPAALDWPIMKDGAPYTFLAQYNFTKSRDLVGTTPGDVLLIFAESDAICTPDAFHFEWHDLGMADQELVSASSMHSPGWRFVTCYGVRHRTYDIADETGPSIVCNFANERFPSMDTDYAFRAHNLLHLNGIKIGGVATWSYLEDNVDNSKTAMLPGRFLCALTDVMPDPFSHPWLNESKPPTLLHILALPNDPECLFFVGDGTTINFSLTDDGEVHWWSG